MPRRHAPARSPPRPRVRATESWPLSPPPTPSKSALRRRIASDEPIAAIRNYPFSINVLLSWRTQRALAAPRRNATGERAARRQVIESPRLSRGATDVHPATLRALPGPPGRKAPNGSAAVVRWRGAPRGLFGLRVTTPPFGPAAARVDAHPQPNRPGNLRWLSLSFPSLILPSEKL